MNSGIDGYIISCKWTDFLFVLTPIPSCNGHLSTTATIFCPQVVIV